MTDNPVSAQIFKGFIYMSVFILFLRCGGEKQIFEFVPYPAPSITKSKLEKIDFFLETSVSMKGYVNASTFGDYPLKEIVPYLITDLDNQYDDITTVYTVTNQPKKYTGTKPQFYDQLRRGTLLGGKSSELQNVFGYIIDSLKQNRVSILVSDCILDLGKNDAMTNGSLVTTKIYRHLINKPNAAVAVFKYLSDFNGTYYYDRKNTGSGYQKARPYYNSILKNRPFYVWILGDKQLVKELLSKKLFENYNKAYAYNISMDDVPYGILKEPSKGRVSVDLEKNRIVMKEVEAKRPVEFTIGIDLTEKPPLYENLFTDVGNYEILPDYLKNTISLKILDKSLLKPTEGLGFTHFLQPILSDLDKKTVEIVFSLKNKPAIWFKETHLADDYMVPAEALEHKTFAFNFITDAFDKAYRDQSNLLEFKFKKQLKQQ